MWEQWWGKYLSRPKQNLKKQKNVYSHLELLTRTRSEGKERTLIIFRKQKSAGLSHWLDGESNLND